MRQSGQPCSPAHRVVRMLKQVCKRTRGQEWTEVDVAAAAAAAAGRQLHAGGGGQSSVPCARSLPRSHLSQGDCSLTSRLVCLGLLDSAPLAIVLVSSLRPTGASGVCTRGVKRCPPSAAVSARAPCRCLPTTQALAAALCSASIRRPGGRPALHPRRGDQPPFRAGCGAAPTLAAACVAGTSPTLVTQAPLQAGSMYIFES